MVVEGTESASFVLVGVVGQIAAVVVDCVACVVG